MPPAPPTEQELDEIRFVAFELRQRDPAEATKILRRIVKRGGATEALAHGALGEILLEEFDDIDGAIHHFRKLLMIAPDVPAGVIGLARALAQNGEVQASQTSYALAVEGLEKLAREAMKAPDDEQAEAVDETILTTLELMLEERDLLHDAHQGKPQTRPNEELLAWAESVSLFDGEEEGDLDDWLRYTHLRSLLATLDGDVAKGLAEIDRMNARLSMPAEQLHKLRSLVFDAGLDEAGAAEEALLSVRAAGANAAAEDLIRAADRLVAIDRLDDANPLVKQVQDALEADEELDPELRDELKKKVQALRAELSPGIVPIGLGRAKRRK